MSEIVAPFLAATIRTATPIALAALGELVVERAGIINIGLEGAVIAGAFGALIGATHGGLALGYLAAAAGGSIVAALLALTVVRWRADQIVSGTALTMLALGATGTLYRAYYGAAGAALTLPTSAPWRVPLLSRLPLAGTAAFVQPAPTYLAYLLAPLIGWWLFRTHAGLALRAIGERPDAAHSAGIAVDRLRNTALLFGGAMGGIAGGTLVLAQAGTFAEGMSAGRGFIAIAIVVIGRWHPVGVVLGAVLFGGASALQFAFQAMGWQAPYQLFLVLPYLLTLVVLTGAVGRARAPAALGKPFDA